MSDNQFITSPTGRLVQGSVFEGSDKDLSGRPRVDKNQNLKTQWFIGVAFPKGPQPVVQSDGSTLMVDTWTEMWGKIYAVGQQDFPAGDFQLPGFAWKVVDGDDPQNVTKEGFAGHYILRMSTGFCPQAFNEANQQVTAEHNAIKKVSNQKRKLM